MISFKTILNPIFMICLALFLINQSIENLGIHIPLIASYLDDILCLPILLTPILFLFRSVLIISPRYCFTKGQILFSFLVLAGVFEIYLPNHSGIYTSDIFDVPAYALGAFIFYVFINKPLKGNLKSIV